MKTASIATAKNELSRLLQRVRRGETILITDRNRPVARLQPLEGEASSATLEPLYAAGVLSPPVGGPLDPVAFLRADRPRLKPGRSLASAVLSEREEGR